MSTTSKKIEEIQQELTKQGYQWSEHCFNDGKPHNTMLRITRNTSPHALGEVSYFYTRDLPRPKVLGWGRMMRETAWDYVGAYLTSSQEERDKSEHKENDFNEPAWFNEPKKDNL